MNSNLLIYASKLVVLCLLSGFVLSAATPAKANSLDLKKSDRTSIDTEKFAESKNAPILLSQSMEQVTSVSQLSDVQPTDWAFQALQSLVERYGCSVTPGAFVLFNPESNSNNETTVVGLLRTTFTF